MNKENFNELRKTLITANMISDTIEDEKILINVLNNESEKSELIHSLQNIFRSINTYGGNQEIKDACNNAISIIYASQNK